MENGFRSDSRPGSSEVPGPAHATALARVLAAANLRELVDALPWLSAEDASRVALAHPTRPVLVERVANPDGLGRVLEAANVHYVRSGNALAWAADPARTADLHGRLRESDPEMLDVLHRALASWGGPASDVPLPAGGALSLSRRVHVMGIVNVTPDSFSDGGQYADSGAAVSHGLALAEEGADVLDIGGESTRPGADPVSADEECRRVLPVVERLAAKISAPVSIDTTKALVAARALDAGAQIINDVSAGRFDPDMFALAAERRAPIVLMHMRGEPRTMQRDPRYRDLVGEVAEFLDARAAAARAAGIDPARILVDPGFGFGKTPGHNLLLLRRLREFRCLGYPVVAGTSRKSFVGAALDLPVEERLEGTAATVALAVSARASVLRVHDVRAMSRVIGMVEAVLGAVELPGSGRQEDV